MPRRDLMAAGANGVVRVDDWVRELPASHFQPCWCCLCRPPGGIRPIFRVRAIEREQGRAYLRFDGEHRYPAEEFERVEPPGTGAGSVVIAAIPQPIPRCSEIRRHWPGCMLCCGKRAA